MFVTSTEKIYVFFNGNILFGNFTLAANIAEGFKITNKIVVSSPFIKETILLLHRYFYYYTTELKFRLLVLLFSTDAHFKTLLVYLSFNYIHVLNGDKLSK